jgi:uncharacterized protein involved in exopolysaccharide biosynthesis
MARDILSASNERSLVSRATDIFRRRKIVILLVFSAVIAAAVSFARYLPDLYRTSATVLVERPVPESYVRSAVSGEVESRMHVIKQEVLSRARLTELIERFNLYPELRSREPMDTVLDQMRHDIEIEPNGPEQLSGRKTTVSFKLSYTGARDDAVAEVTNALASFYVTRNEGIRSQDATRLTEFLKAQLDATKKQIERDEGAMRAYTSQHPGELPSQVDLNLHGLDRLNTQLRLNGERQLKLLEDREKVLEPPTATVDARTGEVVPAAGSDLIADRIEGLKKDLELLEGKGFTSRHPDVVRLRTEITTLQRDRQDSLVRQKESGDAPAAAAVPAGTSGSAGGPSAATTASAAPAPVPARAPHGSGDGRRNGQAQGRRGRTARADCLDREASRERARARAGIRTHPPRLLGDQGSLRLAAQALRRCAARREHGERQAGRALPHSWKPRCRRRDRWRRIAPL